MALAHLLSQEGRTAELPDVNYGGEEPCLAKAKNVIFMLWKGSQPVDFRSEARTAEMDGHSLPDSMTKIFAWPLSSRPQK